MLVRRGVSWRLLFRMASSSVILLVFWIVLCAPSNASGGSTLAKWWHGSALHPSTYKPAAAVAVSTRGGSEEVATVGNDTLIVIDGPAEEKDQNSTETQNTTAIQQEIPSMQMATEVSIEAELEALHDGTGDDEKLSLLERKRLQFLDRIALLSSSWLSKEQDAHLEHITSLDLDAITPESDFTQPGRHFHIVTTAALPWFTGTSVNPLLRAAYLHRRTVEINAANGTILAAKNSSRFVTLVIPWLELPSDQQELYHQVFESEKAQEEFIRNWLKEEADMPDAACPETGLRILFYPARYHSGLRSIFAMGDMLKVVEEYEKDVCILEEPEHINFFRAPGDGWTKKYRYVVGVVHTNYKEYASSHYSGLWTAPAISMVSSAMVRAYCHKVIKLSANLQTYAPEKEVISNVHGVRAEFIREGQLRASDNRQHGVSTSSEAPPKEPLAEVYYVGKLLWAKGLDMMLELEDYYKQCTGRFFPIDIYGTGPEQGAIVRAFHGRRKTEKRAVAGNENTKAKPPVKNPRETTKKKGNPLKRIMRTTLSIFGGVRETGSADQDVFSSLESIQETAKERLARLKKSLDSVELPQTFAELRRTPIPASFPGRVDHAEIKDHAIFVNPSTSEVLCTTTAEALAMGKFAIIPVHPSNSFFLKFPNCLAYRSKFEFVANLRWAMSHDPEPMTPELLRFFTWDAATDRLINASAISVREALERERLGRTRLDERIAWLHNELSKGTSGDILRRICGAGPVSHQSKYVKEKVGSAGTSEQRDDDEDGPEDEDDGLSNKFRSSSFAEAIRATIGDVSSFIQ